MIAAVQPVRAATGAWILPGAGAFLAALALLQALEAAHEDEAPVAHLHDAFVAGRYVRAAGLGRLISGTFFLSFLSFYKGWNGMRSKRGRGISYIKLT